MTLDVVEKADEQGLAVALAQVVLGRPVAYVQIANDVDRLALANLPTLSIGPESVVKTLGVIVYVYLSALTVNLLFGPC